MNLSIHISELNHKLVGEKYQRETAASADHVGLTRAKLCVTYYGFSLNEVKPD